MYCRVLEKWDIDNYLTCDTFPIFDIAIIRKLIEQLLGNIEEYSRYSAMMLARRTLHWYATFQKEYEALYWAV